MIKCIYCTEGADGCVSLLPREGTGNASLHDSASKGPVLVVRGPYKTRVEIRVNFCPICGRDLKERGKT